MHRRVPALGVLCFLVVIPAGAAAQQVSDSDESPSKVSEKDEEPSRERPSDVEVDDSKRFEALARRGIQLYEKKKYAKARAYFEEAYERREEPDMLYNIARCHEHLGQRREAIEYFEKYAKDPDVETDDREEALARVATLRRVHQLEGRAERNPRGEEGNEDEGESGEKQEVAQRSGRGLQTAGWALTGTGAASLIGGGVFALLAAGAQTTMRDATDLSVAQKARRVGRRRALYADGFFGIGLLTGGVGVTLLIVASNSNATTAGLDEDRSRAIRLRPVFGRDAAGLRLGIDF